MAVTAGRARPRWAILLRPRWLAWHAFAVLATAGMLYLGDWQLHRAESGQRAELGIHVRVAAVRDIRRVLLGEDAARRGQESGGRRDAWDYWVDGGPGYAAPGSIAPAAADAYVERLKSEVRGHGKWHGWR